MDGNGRWANKRALPRIAGHHEGMKTVKKITRFANDVGIKRINFIRFFYGKLEKTKSRSGIFNALAGGIFRYVFT